MSDPWDDDPVVTEPWELDQTVDEAIPAGSKSERTLRNSAIFGGRFDPVGAAETGLAMGTQMGSMIGRGVLGIAGTVAGMWPGGESPNEKANRWMDVIPEGTGYQPRTMGGAAGVEGAGKLMEGAVEETKKLGTPVAYAGARLAGASPEEAALSMEDFMSQENALGEGVFQATESPLLATIAQLLPEVASAGVPGTKVKPRGRPSTTRIAPEMPPSGYGGVGPVETPRAVPRGTPQTPEMGAFTELRQALQAGDAQRVRDLISANPAIVGAFEELGIQWSPGMVSENAALRQLEGGLESVADTGIKQTHANTRMQLNQAASDLIESVEGAGSRAGVSTEVASKFDEIRTGMINSEKQMWDELSKKVPRGTPVNARAAADWVENEARLAGRNGNVDDGLRSLSKHERELFRLTHEKQPVQKTRTIDGEDVTVEEMEWVYTEPQYAAIDRFRKDVGDGMNGQGPFGNANSAELDQMYGRLANIQKSVAQDVGYIDDWRAANNATVERKAFEDRMRRTLGRDLNFDAIARIDSAVKDLVNGRTSKWDQLFDDLPDDAKPMAAAQALDKVFFPTKADNMTAKFVDNFNRIKRDAALRDRLFEHLPAEARTTFMNLGEAATGFFRALEDVNFSRTGNARNVVDMMKRPGFMNKVIGGTAETGMGWIPVVGTIIRNARRSAPEARMAAETGRLRAATDLLNDPAFKRSIVEYANGNIERANEILRNSKSWLAWQRTQPIPFQRQIEAAGIVALFTEENEE